MYCEQQPLLIAQLNDCKGINGLTARDIKLIVEGGYNTVESIAYTYATLRSLSRRL